MNYVYSSLLLVTKNILKLDEAIFIDVLTNVIGIFPSLIITIYHNYRLIVTETFFSVHRSKLNHCFKWFTLIPISLFEKY